MKNFLVHHISTAREFPRIKLGYRSSACWRGRYPLDLPFGRDSGYWYSEGGTRWQSDNGGNDRAYKEPIRHWD